MLIHYCILIIVNKRICLIKKHIDKIISHFLICTTQLSSFSCKINFFFLQNQLFYRFVLNTILIIHKTCETFVIGEDYFLTNCYQGW